MFQAGHFSVQNEKKKMVLKIEDIADNLLWIFICIFAKIIIITIIIITFFKKCIAE